MGQVRLAFGMAAALVCGICGAAHAQKAVSPSTRDATTTASVAGASVAGPWRDPDAEVPYVAPRRVIAPPVYGDPGPPLNPNGVPYDDLFASPYPFDIPDSFLRPEDPDLY